MDIYLYNFIESSSPDQKFLHLNNQNKQKFQFAQYNYYIQYIYVLYTTSPFQYIKCINNIMDSEKPVDS